jgi:hypothetical protein
MTLRRTAWSRRLAVALLFSQAVLSLSQESPSKDERPPHKGRLQWFAQKAKDRQQRVIEVPTENPSYDGRNSDLPETLKYSEAIVGQVTDRYVVAADEFIRTWYRVRVVETLHRPTARVELRKLPIPPELPKLGADEFWIIRPGGTVVMNDVELFAPTPIPPMETGHKYLLFGLVAKNGIGATAGGPQGVFAIDDDSKLTSVAGKTRLAIAIANSANNQLDRLREVIKRIETASP